MRGYFAIGIDQVSKAGNMGNLIRTAHSFGAAYTFAITPKNDSVTGEPVTKDFLTDTANSPDSMPFFQVNALDEMPRPAGTRMVAIELTDDAIDLPSFRHPTRAIYILGGERYEVSDEILRAADDVIRIPTRFSLNVATAGAIVMYDRMRLLGGFPDRPIMAGQKPQDKKVHKHGGPISRIAKREGKSVGKGTKQREP